MLYDRDKKTIVRTGTTCASTGTNVWSTPVGNLLAVCADGLVLYDREFRAIARFRTGTGHYSYEIVLSPTHEFVAAVPLPRQGDAKVLATGTLVEVADFPSQSGYVIGLYRDGYLVYDSMRGREGFEVNFHQFLGSQPISLMKSPKNCSQVGFGISESEFVKLACGKGSGEILNIVTAQPRVSVSETESADFAQTSLSGRRFALGFQDYSKAHVIKQFANPFTYIAALGTCCDDPSNLFRLRIYDQQSVTIIAEFHWKTHKKEPMRERLDNSAVALSPSGEYVAFLRGSLVEVYRIPAVGH